MRYPIAGYGMSQKFTFAETRTFFTAAKHTMNQPPPTEAGRLKRMGKNDDEKIATGGAESQPCIA